MFFQKHDVYPSNVLFITVIAFKSVGLLRNNYYKIRSNAPSNLVCSIWNFIFMRFGIFWCLSNDIALKGLYLHHCIVLLLFCDAIVISEPFFPGSYFRPDFAAIRWKKFGAWYFWFKAKLKQKKFIFKWHSVTSTWEIKIGRFYFLAGNHWLLVRRRAS